MQAFTRQKLDQQRAYLRRSNGVKSRWAADGTPLLLTPVRNWKEFNAPTVLGSLKARRGRCVLSAAKRSMILDQALAAEAKRLAREEARDAFFAELSAASGSAPPV